MYSPPSARVEGCSLQADWAGWVGTYAEEPAAALPAGTLGHHEKTPALKTPDLLSQRGTKFPVLLQQEATFPFGNGTQ